MTIPDKLNELVELFKDNIDDYKSGNYNETQVRREFIDPLFELLGWDVANRRGYAAAYKQVVHEDALKIGGATKAPDYSFRIGGARKFFLEAKKPSVNIKDDIHPAYQLRRYAWSAKLPLSILTDFEEFAVYDCRIKPVQTDKASNSRIMYLNYSEYADNWDELLSIFSPDAIMKGSFDKYVTSKSRKKGTAEVDDEFLAEIEKWRVELARNIALRNPGLNRREMNFAVQRTIDRVIFLRICEDRGAEDYGRLMALQNGTETYKKLFELFRQADDRYNSGLFHFADEKGREGDIDTLTPGMQIDDGVLKEIFKNLYYPDSPYEFSVLSADILGQVYERFLGKVIRLTPSHRAIVEEKPEVRKAGGVYYTPTYIVDYIVKQTVGKPLERKKPGAAKLNILDPACGSGSFLLGAYQYLLDWHRDKYTEEGVAKWAKGKAPALFQSGSGEWRLTIHERKRILLENIYGVDIDPQAVEVTKLSLLLKVLEGEDIQTIGKQTALLKERVLPDLANNIKCGNSLIGPDFYEGRQTSLIEKDEEEIYRINAFDWENEFKEIMTNGGFDAVIGNPPYVRQELLGEVFKTYANHRYLAYAGTADIYVYFIEKALNLLRKKGVLSYIISNKWFKAGYGREIRRLLHKNRIIEIIDFNDLRVFQSATTYPCILSVANDSPQKELLITEVKTLNFENLETYIEKNKYFSSTSLLDDNGWMFLNKVQSDIFDKISRESMPLGEYIHGDIYRGILSGFDEAFVIDCATKELLIEQDGKSKEIIRPYLAGKDLKRYEYPKSEKYLIFTKQGIEIKKYSAIYNYLGQFKEQLTPKPYSFSGNKWKGRKPGKYKWYEIQDTVNYYKKFSKPKIIFLKFQVKPVFTYDKDGFYGNSATFIIPKDDKYLLGILNSKFGWYLISKYCSKIQNGYQLIYKYLKNIPIHRIDIANASEVQLQQSITSNVESILLLKTELESKKSPQDKKVIQRRIEALDNQIDKLVYKLYGLTADEIKIIEGN